MKTLNLTVFLASVLAALSAVADEPAGQANVCGRNPKIREGIEIAVKKYCHRITGEDLHFVDPILSFGDWTEDGEATSLSAHDFSDLSRLHTLTFMAPLSRVHSDAFDLVANLKWVNLRAPERMERLNPSQKLVSMLLTGDFARNIAVRSIADAAFSLLPNLQVLSLNLDMAGVDIGRALSGVTRLTYLSLYLRGTSQVPGDVLRLVSLNPRLKSVTLGMLSGKVGSAQEHLQAMGFKCTDESPYVPAGEQISCQR